MNGTMYELISIASVQGHFQLHMYMYIKVALYLYR